MHMLLLRSTLVLKSNSFTTHPSSPYSPYLEKKIRTYPSEVRSQMRGPNVLTLLLYPYQSILLSVHAPFQFGYPSAALHRAQI